MLEPYERDAIIKVAITTLELEVERMGYKDLYLEPYLVDGKPDTSGVTLYMPRGDGLRNLAPIFRQVEIEVRNMQKNPHTDITYDISRDRTRLTIRAKKPEERVGE